MIKVKYSTLCYKTKEGQVIDSQSLVTHTAANHGNHGSQSGKKIRLCLVHEKVWVLDTVVFSLLFGN